MITKFVIFGVWKFLSINKQITFECVHFYSIICPLRPSILFNNQMLRYTKVPKGSKQNNNIKNMWVIENVILVRLYGIGKHEKNAHRITIKHTLNSN